LQAQVFQALVLQEGQLIITELPLHIHLQALEHFKFLILRLRLLKFLQLGAVVEQEGHRLVTQVERVEPVVQFITQLIRFP
jgi:hypothetical protein